MFHKSKSDLTARLYNAMLIDDEDGHIPIHIRQSRGNDAACSLPCCGSLVE